MEKETVITPRFKEAARDYLHMLERDYPRRPLLKLIADKFQLDRVQRNLLLRGIAPRALSATRAEKRTELIAGQKVYVDFYNIFFTICNYYYGATLFICTDSYLRDCGEMYGKIREESQLRKIIDLILSFLKDSRPEESIFILDSPVSSSGDTAGYLNRELSSKDLSGRAYTTKSPDHELKKINDGIIATSDSIIIEKTPASVYDLSYFILIRHHQPEFLNLNHLV
jgi:hypothetical protein